MFGLQLEIIVWLGILNTSLFTIWYWLPLIKVVFSKKEITIDEEIDNMIYNKRTYVKPDYTSALQSYKKDNGYEEYKDKKSGLYSQVDPD